MILVVSSFFHRSHVAGMGGYPLISVKIVVVRGGYLLHVPSHKLIFLVKARASSEYGCCRGYDFPAKFGLLNNMDCIIRPSCYWSYAIYFWVLVQSKFILLQKKFYIFFCFRTGFRSIKCERLIWLVRRDMHTTQTLFPW
jgi:hypothetical protein